MRGLQIVANKNTGSSVDDEPDPVIIEAIEFLYNSKLRGVDGREPKVCHIPSVGVEGFAIKVAIAEELASVEATEI